MTRFIQIFRIGLSVIWFTLSFGWMTIFTIYVPQPTIAHQMLIFSILPIVTGLIGGYFFWEYAEGKGEKPTK